MNFSIFTKLGRAVVMALAVAALVLTGCGDDNGANSGGGGGGGGGGSNSGSFTYDGQTYKTVKIGGKTWMAENLNVETANSKCYNNSADSCAKYGRQYLWSEAKSACQSVGGGWRLPDTADWRRVVEVAGGGNALKSKTGWKINNGTDKYGFSALPGGEHNYVDGRFHEFYGGGEVGYWWTSTEKESLGYYRRMIYDLDAVYENTDEKARYGYSARCVKD